MIRKIILILLFFTINLYANKNSFGLGVVHSTNLYMDQKEKTTLFPFLNYTHNKFYIKALEMGYKYNQNISFIGQAKLNSVEIAGIDKRKSTFETGFKLTYPMNRYKLSFKTLFDTLGVYHGYNSSLKISSLFMKKPFVFIPSVGIEYQNSKSSDYYFGVDKHESFSYYQLQSTINKTIGFVTIYNINKKNALSFIYSYKKLDQDIKNSPIVVADNKQFSMLSFVYKF